jgi:hypothetical protein
MTADPVRSDSVIVNSATDVSRMTRILPARFLLAGLLIALALLFGPRANAACNPGTNQVAFFTDAGFKGSCVVKGLGNYASAGAIGLPNDSISSVQIGPNAQAVVCKDNNFQGDCILITSSVSYLNGGRVGNDEVSSAKVQAVGMTECMPGNNQASFYTNADYLGNCVVKDIGDYPNAGAIGLANDSISSVRVGSGVQVVLCKDNGFQGDCIVQTTSTNYLNGSRVGNDQVSSAKIQAKGTTECMPGAGQASFYTNADFQGSCVIKPVGTYATSESIGLPNDSISAVRLGQGVQVVLCKDVNFKGDCILLTSSQSYVNDSRVGNDATTSAKVQPSGTMECEPGSNQVGLFMHADYLAPCVVKGIGNYPDAASIGLDDKSITGIRIGTGVQACGCTGNNFTTQCEAFTASTPYLTDHNPPFNDFISSLRVQPAGAACQAATTPPQGYDHFQVFNCDTDHRTISVWTRDITAGAAFVSQGKLAPQYSADGSCPVGTPLNVPLPNAHQVQFVAVDPGNIACGGVDDPTMSPCQRSTFTLPFLGTTGGPVLPITVD